MISLREAQEIVASLENRIRALFATDLLPGGPAMRRQFAETPVGKELRLLKEYVSTD